MTPRPGSDLLTIPETAVALRLSPKTIYRLIADGALPVTDVARPGSFRPRSRVPRSAVNAFIAARTRTA
jgi:excisionase family DNA binding protein